MNRLASIITLTSVLFCGTVGCNTDKKPEPKADLPKPAAFENKQAFYTLATELADGWTADRSAPRPKKDQAQVLAEIQNAILAFNAIKSDDPSLLHIRDEARTGAQQVAEAVRTLNQLPQPPSVGEVVVSSFIYGLMLRIDRGLEVGEKAQNQAIALRDQVRQLALAIQRVETAKLMLRHAGSKYAGTKLLSASQFAVDIDEAIGSREPDWMALTNNTGHDLHNALVSVTLLGKDGESKENIHFIPCWKAGQTIHGRYDVGMFIGDTVVARQTVVLIQSAKISIASDEGHQDNIAYKYAGAEKDKDVQRFLNRIDMTGKYRPYSPGIFGTNRGVTVRFTGQPLLPKGKLTAWFRNGDVSKVSSMTFTQWQPGQEKRIEFPDITWDPAEYGISVELEGSTASRACSTPQVLNLGFRPRQMNAPAIPGRGVIQEIRTQ